MLLLLFNPSGGVGGQNLGLTWGYMAGFTFNNTVRPSSTWSIVPAAVEMCS